MIGQQVLNYRIEALIGEGGMGNVYLAVHTHIGRKVAIKALNQNLARNPDIRERFKNEAATLSQLHHPNIVALYDYVEADNGVFLIMEYVEGKALDEYIQTVTGPIPEEKAIPLLLQIIDGVEYAHSCNVIHRDIKPGNIIITPEGNAKILDFGIAKIISESDHRLTKTGTKLGTVLYMSPEQVKGTDADLRTDIYSLGITFFQMLTGQCPYDKQQSEYEVYKKIVEEPLPNPRHFYVGVSDHMIAVLEKAAAKNAEDRFNCCDEMRAALLGKDTINTGPNVEPDKESETSPIKKRNSGKAIKRSRGLVLWNILMACVLSGTIILGIIQLSRSQEKKYVLSHSLWLRSTKSNTNNSNVIKKLDFGEAVRMIEDPEYTDDMGQKWVKVTTTDDHIGFVALDYLGSRQDFEQISLLFGEDAQKQTPVIFKLSVLKYCRDKAYIDKQKRAWKVYSESPGSDFNTIAQADFNGDGRKDYACILENNTNNRYLLLAFIDYAKGSELKLESSHKSVVLIKTMGKGSRWYTGKSTTEHIFDSNGNIIATQKKIFETLENDGLLVWEKASEKKLLYTFDAGHNTFNQPKVSH